MTLEITIKAPELAIALNNLASAISGSSGVHVAAPVAAPAPTPVAPAPAPVAQAPAPTPVAPAPAPAPAADPNAIDGPALKARILNACRANQSFATDMQAAFKQAGFESFDKVPPAQYPNLLSVAAGIAAKHGVAL